MQNSNYENMGNSSHMEPIDYLESLLNCNNLQLNISNQMRDNIFDIQQQAADCREPVASQSSGLFPSHKRRQASDDDYPHPGKMSRPMIERPEPEIYPDHVEEPDDNPLEGNPSEYQQWTNQPGTKQESGHAGLDDIIRDVIENFPFA